MSSQYPAIYTDSYGQEQTIIELESDGRFLFMKLRGVLFRGISFDTFYAWPVEQNPENLRRFHWEEGEIIADGSQSAFVRRAITEYTLQWTIPLQTVQQDQILRGTMQCVLEQREPTKEHRFGFSQVTIVLHIAQTTLKIATDDPTMGTILGQFQKRLPQGMYLKCCRFCALSLEDIYEGSHFWCYRRVKEQIHAIKHQPYRNKVQHPINQLRNEALYVQAMHLCPEFEVDWVSVREGESFEQ